MTAHESPDVEAHVEALWYGVGDDIEAFRAYLTDLIAAARADERAKITAAVQAALVDTARNCDCSGCLVAREVATEVRAALDADTTGGA
jgi:hypothetical protein